MEKWRTNEKSTSSGSIFWNRTFSVSACCETLVAGRVLSLSTANIQYGFLIHGQNRCELTVCLQVSVPLLNVEPELIDELAVRIRLRRLNKTREQFRCDGLISRLLNVSYRWPIPRLGG